MVVMEEEEYVVGMEFSRNTSTIMDSVHMLLHAATIIQPKLAKPNT
jgi:hypothetical protein